MAIPTRANTNTEVLADTNEFGYVSGSDNELADLDENGLAISIETEEIEVRSGTQRGIYAYLRGTVGQLWEGAALNFNVNNLAFCLGLNEDATNITGAGTTADPYVLVIDPEKFGEELERTYYVAGARLDGTAVRAEAAARVFSPNLEFSFAQGQVTVLPFQLRITTSWQIETWDPTT